MAILQLEMLSEDEKCIAICRDYWNCDEEGKFATSVAQIAKTYSIKQSEVSKIAYSNCNAYSEDILCSRCQNPLVFENRSTFQNALRWLSQGEMCLTCREEEAQIQKSLRQEQALKRRDSIEKIYALVSSEVPRIHSLTLEDAVYLLSFIRVAASEDLTEYESLDSVNLRLTPTSTYTGEIANHLHSQGLIRVHPNSPLDAFAFDNNNNPERAYTFKVKWTLVTGDDLGKTRSFIAYIENTFRHRELWPASWQDQCLKLWRKVAFHECMEYLEAVLKEHKFELNAGEKTNLVLECLLENHPVSQIYNLIWSSGRDAAAFYMRGSVTKPHAANTVIGNMQRRSERGLAEGWEFKPYRRDRRCPQSVVSQVLFNVALKIGEAGFNEIPHAIMNGQANNPNPDQKKSDDSEPDCGLVLL